MSEPITRRMDVDTFLQWEERQEFRFELVDGRPVAMTGATFAHDRVVGNIRRLLANELRRVGSPCDAFGADIGVFVNPWTLRRPDAAVYCPPFDETAAKSDRPRLVAEVLSRSTVEVDHTIKFEEYQGIAAVQAILLVNPRFVDVGLWTREGTEWRRRHLRTLEDRAAIPDLGITVALADIYDRVELVPAPGPRLVWPDDAAPAGD